MFATTMPYTHDTTPRTLPTPALPIPGATQDAATHQSCSISMEDLSHLPQLSVRTDLSPRPPSIYNDSLIDLYHCYRSVSDADTIVRRRLSAQNAGEDTSLVDELVAKYFTEQGICSFGDDAVFGKMLPSPTKSGLFPGKRSASGQLQLIVLDHSRIGRLGDLVSLSQMVSHVTEIDLTGNNIHDWRHVTTLLSLMPQLKLLNLSSNKLSAAPPVQWSTSTGKLRHEKLRQLVLNDTNVCFSALFTLLHMLPGLEELYISCNDYSSRKHLPSRALLRGDHTDCTPPRFHSIKALYANRCAIKDWKSVIRLCQPYPGLQELVIAENPIERISDASQFDGITRINMNRTILADWGDLDTFNDFVNLVHLRINEIPLLHNCTETEKWHLVVARLPNVQILNGTTITDEKRIDSERFFIRHCDLAGDEAKGERYTNLLAKHGALERLVEIDLRPQTHVRMRVMCQEIEYDKELTLLLDQSVQMLRAHLATTVFDKTMLASRVRVFYQSEGSLGPDELRLNTVRLHAIGCQDGELLIVELKPPPAPRKTTVTRLATSPRSQ